MTATPRYLARPGGYLTEPSALAPADVAIQFLQAQRQLYRLSDEDISALKLRSRAQAVAAAARSLGIAYSAVPIADTPLLATYGNVDPEFLWAPTFSGAGVFSDPIVVRPVVFPLGTIGRYAYEFTLTTPQYMGVMWQNVVDALPLPPPKTGHIYCVNPASIPLQST